MLPAVFPMESPTFPPFKVRISFLGRSALWIEEGTWPLARSDHRPTSHSAMENKEPPKKPPLKTWLPAFQHCM